MIEEIHIQKSGMLLVRQGKESEVRRIDQVIHNS